MTLSANLNFEVFDSGDQACAATASLFADQLEKKRDSVFGFATGRTPVAFYSAFVNILKRRALSLSRATSFNLDEYVGLSPDYPNSYHSYMKQHLLDQTDLSADRVFIPNGTENDLHQGCIDYEAKLEAHSPIDMQLLGLGENGHIAFNEPGSLPSERTRLVELSRSTREANGPMFPTGETVPTQAISMGIGTILSAKAIILIACGNRKRSALDHLLTKLACRHQALELAVADAVQAGQS